MKPRFLVMLALAVVAALLPGNAAAEPAVIATVPVGNGPYGVAVNLNTNRIYVTNAYSSTVSVIDGATNTVVESVSFPSEVAPFGVAVNPTTDRIYVTTPANDALGGGPDTSKTVSVMDGATNTVTDTVSVGVFPADVAVNPTTNRIYVANFGSGDVSVIDGATNTVVVSVPLGAGVGPWGIAVNPITDRIYVANRASDSVSVIDGVTHTVVASVPVGDGSWDVAVNPTTNRIYATIHWGYADSVSVIDGTTNTVVDSVPVGEITESVAVNPATNHIYVSKFQWNTISVIDGNTNTVVATLGAGDGTEGVAANPVTNHIYVANHFDDTVSVIEEDTDWDGLVDSADNCPAVPNPDQLNTDSACIPNGADITGECCANPDKDAEGDVCDLDHDNDGPDANDGLYDDTEEAVGCGFGATNELSKDSDGDRAIDGYECRMGTDPNNAAERPTCSDPTDTDGDGFSDCVEELGYGTLPDSTDTDGDGCEDDKQIVDVNGNGQANILDVLAIATIALAPGPFDPVSQAVADMNKDGDNNALDVILAVLNSTLVEPHAPCR